MSFQPQLCRVCRTIDLEKLLAGESTHRISLGTLLSINKKKNECSFCNFIVKSARLSGAAKEKEPIFHAHDGSLISCSIDYRGTGWNVIQNGSTKYETAVKLDFRGHWDSEFTGFNSIARRLVPEDGSEELFCGRRLLEDHINFDTIKSWIAVCTSSHNSVNEYAGCGTREWEHLQKRPCDLKVIDVTNDCITTLPKGESYVALSYVWGQTTTLMATKENRDVLSKLGGLSRAANKVPIARTILDAIILTQKVDIGYIWVDSLCIVQDDEADKLRLIDEMASIYLAAAFTIIAAAGDNANAGLPGVQLNSRKIEQIIAKVSPELSLVHPTLMKTNIESSTWNTRGWTYQERLYSKRMLVFLPDGVYWQCRTVIWVEDVVHEHPSAQDHEMMDFRARLRFLNPDLDWAPKPPIDITSGGQPLLFHHPTLEEYEWTVREYSRRQLTYPGDIERAYTGVQNVLKLGLKDFQYGLPISYLDMAILWKPKGVLLRRDGSATTFPTWSWMGWIGSIAQRANFPSPRYTPEERSRPLLYWYMTETNGVLTRLHQAWEETNNRFTTQSQRLIDQWKPLSRPESMHSTPPSLGASLKLDSVRYLTFRSCIATFSVQASESTNLGTSSLTYNIYEEHRWVGSADFHHPVSDGSYYDFIILSEAQLSGVPELDKNSRIDFNHFNFFNVLAVTWDNKSQPWDKSGNVHHLDHALLAYRCGCGVISKEAWAQATTRWSDIILG
jgi:hypothetical protein